MTYAEALAYISKQGRFGMKLGTERTRAILDRMGAPDRGLRGALIAGTNGKGSTGACLAAVLRATGRNVGFMPKPHLVSYTERIELNGRPISEHDFVETLKSLMPVLDAIAAEMGQATEFEMLTAMALAYLAPRIDQLVCEVGLGGRLDATNALDLGVAVITNVDLDHQKYLGDTIEQIAHEKAAIVKPGDSVVTGCEGSALSIVEEHARSAGVPVWVLGRDIQVKAQSRGWQGHLMDVTGPGFEHRDLILPLVGDYQPANAALAIAAAHLLESVTDDPVFVFKESALRRTRSAGTVFVVSSSVARAQKELGFREPAHWATKVCAIDGKHLKCCARNAANPAGDVACLAVPGRGHRVAKCGQPCLAFRKAAHESKANP